MDIEIKRLDHLGIVAGVIKDLKLIEMIDERIKPDELEEISTGEAVAGMILNGLGFSQKPLSLTPQFFKNKPMEQLFREGVEADHFNRFKLGRSLDKAFNYGVDCLFSELSFPICKAEQVDLRFNDLDTTSFSLTGDYVPDTDEQAIHITHGYSKDHRADLKQAVLEMVVSQDGGIPLFCKCHDGNASDNEIFKHRANELIRQFKAGSIPRYLIMDSKGYTKKNAPNLAKVPYITRIPETFNDVKLLINQALSWDDQWITINKDYRFQCFELGHYHIDQRWMVVYSQGAFERAEKTLNKRSKKEDNSIEKQLFHLQAQRFKTKKEASKALEELSEKWKYHEIDEFHFHKHVKYAKKGKPTADSPIKSIQWQIKATFKRDEKRIAHAQHCKACFVLGTSIPLNQLSNEDVFWGYKNQSQVERGFRFLKDPVFFVSSLFVKKPSRVQSLLMVMTLALLVYSIAQRRMRKKLEQTGESLPNQIGQPTKTPTLRWVFQLLEGIDHVKIKIQNGYQTVINGITDLHRKILKLFGNTVCRIYQIYST
ncbi:MAG: IS1634 family transposase [Deltaproteobacteria bacterium]|nr:IS1634 family transposase [Deltaproteobacteria bacterium]